MSAFWDDQWPSRITDNGEKIPRIWKRTDEPWPDIDPKLVTEDGQWRWPWYYRIPGWVSCYTDSWESAMARVQQYWIEYWIYRQFGVYSFSAVRYPWAEPLPIDYKPPGVYC